MTPPRKGPQKMWVCSTPPGRHPLRILCKGRFFTAQKLRKKKRCFRLVDSGQCSLRLTGVSVWSFGTWPVYESPGPKGSICLEGFSNRKNHFEKQRFSRVMWTYVWYRIFIILFWNPQILLSQILSLSSSRGCFWVVLSTEFYGGSWLPTSRWTLFQKVCLPFFTWICFLGWFLTFYHGKSPFVKILVLPFQVFYANKSKELLHHLEFAYESPFRII